MNRDFRNPVLTEQITDFGLIKVGLGEQRVSQYLGHDTGMETLVPGRHVIEVRPEQKVGENSAAAGQYAPFQGGVCH